MLKLTNGVESTGDEFGV